MPNKKHIIANMIRVNMIRVITNIISNVDSIIYSNTQLWLIVAVAEWK